MYFCKTDNIKTQLHSQCLRTGLAAQFAGYWPCLHLCPSSFSSPAQQGRSIPKSHHSSKAVRLALAGRSTHHGTWGSLRMMSLCLAWHFGNTINGRFRPACRPAAEGVFRTHPTLEHGVQAGGGRCSSQQAPGRWHNLAQCKCSDHLRLNRCRAKMQIENQNRCLTASSHTIISKLHRFFCVSIFPSYSTPLAWDFRNSLRVSTNGTCISHKNAHPTVCTQEYIRTHLHSIWPLPPYTSWNPATVALPWCHLLRQSAGGQHRDCRSSSRCSLPMAFSSVRVQGLRFRGCSLPMAFCWHLEANP